MNKIFTASAALATLLFLGGFASEAIASSPERSKSGLFPDEIISAERLSRELKENQKIVLFDARDKRSYDNVHIQGALLPRTEEFYRQEELFRTGIVSRAPDPESALKEAMQKYSPETPIITYCNANCHASAVLALRLKSLGFTDVKSMEEGVQAWEKKGYPVERLIESQNNL